MKVFLLFLIAVGNYWFVRILSKNFIIGILLIILTFTLYKARDSLLSRRTFVVLILTAVLSLYALANSFDRNIARITSAEELKANQRFSYLSYELGPLFQNKASIWYFKNLSNSVEKYQRNLFWNLDPNLYFFTTHPRERVEVNEFNKFFAIELVFFVVGMISIMKNGNTTLWTYLILVSLVSGFIDPRFNLGPILFFPFITIVIFFGIEELLILLKLKK